MKQCLILPKSRKLVKTF